MKAVSLTHPSTADELQVTEVPTPTVKPGWVLVKVKGFGINRSELFTRKGLSPSVVLPRIIGIECVGEVADPSDSGLVVGQRVVSLMGGLGRRFDGSYAQYTLIPTEQVYPIESSLDWVDFAAIPEMYYTAWCSLTEALMLHQGETLLVRGGSSSVGLAAIQLARYLGVEVVATTRSTDKRVVLMEQGAHTVLIDDGTLAPQLEKHHPHGVDKVLELIGTTTLASSFTLLKQGGIVCMSGILGNQWEIEHFAPMDFIPSGSYLTIYDSEQVDPQTLNSLFAFIETHQLKPRIARVFPLEDIAQAHQLMEANTANGKIVIEVE